MLKYIVEKEIIKFRRNRFILCMIIFLPIIVMAVCPFVTSLEVKNVKVCVVDNDHSTMSQRFIDELSASRYFIYNGTVASYAEGLGEIEKANADLFVVIPKHYENKLMRGEKTRMEIVSNAINGPKGVIAANYASVIIVDNYISAFSTFKQNVADKLFSSYSLYNPQQSYPFFMIPALMVIVFVAIGCSIPAQDIVNEKEIGTINQINVSPVRRSMFIYAKTIPYAFIGLFVLTTSLLTAWLVHGVTCEGSYLTLYALSFLLIISLSGLGLTVSNFSNTMQQATFTVYFFDMSMILLSGLFTPFRSMPEIIQKAMVINPVAYFIDAFRTIFVRGGGFSDVSTQFIAIAIFGFLMNCLGIITYKKNVSA